MDRKRKMVPKKLSVYKKSASSQKMKWIGK